MPSSIRSHFRRGAQAAKASTRSSQGREALGLESHWGSSPEKKDTACARRQLLTQVDAPTRGLMQQLDGHPLWEDVEPWVLDGANLTQATGFDGKSVWSALTRLIGLWDQDSFQHGGSYHWSAPQSAYKLRYIEEKMQVLLAHGAPIDALCVDDDWGNGTFLNHLCCFGRRASVAPAFVPLVRLALEMGADPDSALGLLSPRERVRSTPLLLDVFSAQDARHEARAIGAAIGVSAVLSQEQISAPQTQCTTALQPALGSSSPIETPTGLSVHEAGAVLSRKKPSRL